MTRPGASRRRWRSGGTGSTGRGSPTIAGAIRSNVQPWRSRASPTCPQERRLPPLRPRCRRHPAANGTGTTGTRWLRDSTFTLRALHWLNLDWEADEFMQYVADLEVNEDGALQIMYGIDGRRDLTESTLPHLSGYAGASPVRVGNGAFDQRQNDVFGAALDSFLLHTRRSQRMPRRLWPLIQAQAECASGVWREPDQGIWEARGKPQHYVSSKLMCWVALDRAAKLAHLRGAGDLKREVGCDRRRDPRRHREARSQRPWCAASALRDRRLGRLHVAGADLRVPSRRRRAGPQQRAGDRRRAHRERLRAALSHRRDRRRTVGQGRHVPDLLVLARVSAGDRRRAGSGPAT